MTAPSGHGKMAVVLNGMMWLLGCQLVGEIVVRTFDLPVPGPVIGMVLLFVLLQVRHPEPTSGLLRMSDALLRHLQLLFVPPGVGIVVYLSAVRNDALPITGAMVVSWLAGLATVGALVTLLIRRRSAT